MKTIYGVHNGGGCSVWEAMFVCRLGGKIYIHSLRWKVGWFLCQHSAFLGEHKAIFRHWMNDWGEEGLTSLWCFRSTSIWLIWRTFCCLAYSRWGLCCKLCKVETIRFIKGTRPNSLLLYLSEVGAVWWSVWETRVGRSDEKGFCCHRPQKKLFWWLDWRL